MSQWFLRALARINLGPKVFSPFSFDFGRRYTSACFVYLSPAYSWPHNSIIVKRKEIEEKKKNEKKKRLKISQDRSMREIAARFRGTRLPLSIAC